MNAVFLDTSVQVDRAFEGGLADNKASIDALIMQYDITASCRYSKLEFKRVVIQNLALILNYLSLSAHLDCIISEFPTRCLKSRTRSPLRSGRKRSRIDRGPSPPPPRTRFFDMSHAQAMSSTLSMLSSRPLATDALNVNGAALDLRQGESS
jgi:hypothetical protein